VANDQKGDATAEALASIAESLGRISRQLDAGLKLTLKDQQGERSTTEMIRMLGELGCASADIAEWLRSPLTTVMPILSRAKKKPAKAARRAQR
jgi:hypothetical protein